MPVREPLVPSGMMGRRDHARERHKTLRTVHGRRRRLLHRTAGEGHRVPRTQRRRQVHQHAHHGGADPAGRWPRADRRAPLLRRSPTRPATWASCSTPRPSTPAAPAARCCGSAPRRWASAAQRVEEMLDLVGLSGDEAKRRVRNYSLGMRQRLGIANALLGDPSVLILDEPVNGLDPAGIHWMRGLLRNFAAQGGTVLLSSHLLHEVEMIADEMVLIGRGKIVAQGTKAELLQTAGHLREAGGSRRRCAQALAERPASRPCPSGDGGFRAEAEPVDIGRAAAAAGVVLVELKPAEGAGLEEMFLQLTADDAREHAAVTQQGGPPHEHDRPDHRSATLDIPDRPHRVPFARAGQGRAAQDLRHPRRRVAARHHRVPGRGRHGDRPDRRARCRTSRSSSTTSSGSPTSSPASCCPCSASCWSPVSGASAPPWSTFTLEPHRGRIVAAKLVGRPVAGPDRQPDRHGLGVHHQRHLRRGPRRRRLALRLPRAPGLPAHPGDRDADRVRLRDAAAQHRGGHRRLLRLRFLVPTIFAIAAELLDWFKDVQPWIDFTQRQQPLFDASITGKEWAQLLVAGFIWLVLPFSLGLWRVLRAEVK